jgi:hypothetical protein
MQNPWPLACGRDRHRTKYIENKEKSDRRKVWRRRHGIRLCRHLEDNLKISTLFQLFSKLLKVLKQGHNGILVILLNDCSKFFLNNVKIMCLYFPYLLVFPLISGIILDNILQPDRRSQSMEFSSLCLGFCPIANQGQF